MTTAQQENQMGLQAWQEIQKQEKLSKDKRYVDAVNRVGKNLSAVADDQGFHWEFLVFDSKTPNAFCLPGGKVAVYTALFKFFDNDAQLATVVGHEIGHAIARHSGERLTHEMLRSVGQKAIEASVSEANMDNWMMAYGLASQVGAILPYSRAHEYEADKIGMLLMAKAGYDPRQAIVFWERFAKLSNTSTLGESFSTHPMSAKRVRDMEELLPKAMQIYEQAPVKRGLGVIYQ